MGEWELAQWGDGAECSRRGPGMCKARSADNVARLRDMGSGRPGLLDLGSWVCTHSSVMLMRLLAFSVPQVKHEATNTSL